MRNFNRRRDTTTPSCARRYAVVTTLAALTLHASTTMPTASAAVSSGCNAKGYNVDPDPAGLNVRNAPSAKAKVVGQLYPSLDEDTLRTDGPTFTITGYSSGWVKIAGAQPTTIAIDSAGERKNYTGAGWVSAKRVTPLFVLGDGGVDFDFKAKDRKAYAKPSLRSAIVEDWAKANINSQFASFGSDPLIVGCSGRWLRVTYRVAGYYDRTGTWAEYEAGDPERGRTLTAWVQGDS